MEETYEERENEPGRRRSTADELVEATAIGEDENSNINIAKDREFASLLDETRTALRESDLTTAFIFNSLHLYLPSSHPYLVFVCRLWRSYFLSLEIEYRYSQE